jgi:hypothetical protein
MDVGGEGASVGPVGGEGASTRPVGGGGVRESSTRGRETDIESRRSIIVMQVACARING